MQKKFKWWLWIPLGLFASFMALGFVQSNTPEGKEQSRQRHSIDYCWKSQGRKSFDAGMAQFVAGVCEKMEDDFFKRWGFKP
jgi:hypothetical protein